jgi:hypothetical protein
MNLIVTLLFLIVCLSLNTYRINAIKNTITSPSVLIISFFFLYSVIGVKLFWKGSYIFLENNYQPTLVLTYSAITLFITIFFLTEKLSFTFIKTKISKDNFLHSSATSSLKFFGLINIYTLTILISGFIFLPVINSYGILIFFVNTLSPIIGYYLINKDRKFYIYFFFFLILIIELKFRYRLVIFLSPIIIYYLMKNNIISIKFLFKFILFLLFLIIVIVITGYNKGDLSDIKFLFSNFSNELINSLFNDTSTVLLTGAFIHEFDNTFEYAYLKQIKYILSYFLPNFLIGDKLYSPILDYINIIAGSELSGSATLGIAEYYHTAGYPGIIIFAFIFSLLLTYFYKRQIIIKSKYNEFSYYCLIFWYINSLTRAYLPQNIFDLFCTLFGLFLIQKSSNKRLE